MARHDIDPVLQQLVRAINESGQAAVPVTVSAPPACPVLFAPGAGGKHSVSWLS